MGAEPGADTPGTPGISSAERSSVAAPAPAMTAGRPGVCLSTLGPGSTTVLNGVASAPLEGFGAPLIIEARVDPAQYEAQF